MSDEPLWGLIWGSPSWRIYVAVPVAAVWVLMLLIPAALDALSLWASRGRLWVRDLRSHLMAERNAGLNASREWRVKLHCAPLRGENWRNIALMRCQEASHLRDDPYLRELLKEKLGEVVVATAERCDDEKMEKLVEDVWNVLERFPS